jgi:molybdenum cofactor guanylyltransferase
MLSRTDITGIVLAGGLGRRMSSDGRGVDKGLQSFDGRPMVGHVIERLRPQVATLVINANRNRERYSEFGYPVIADRLDGFAGPLAGLQAGLRAATTSHVATVPCDSPFLPADLVSRLSAGLSQSDAVVAVAITGAQVHPVFALVDCALASDLERFLAAGGRKVDAWYASLRYVEVPFTDETGFKNINTREELMQSETAVNLRKPGAQAS